MVTFGTVHTTVFQKAQARSFLPIAFQIGEELGIEVLLFSGNKRPSPSYMNDGFNRGATNGYNRPAPHYRTNYTQRILAGKQPNQVINDNQDIAGWQGSWVESFGDLFACMYLSAYQKPFVC